MKVIIDMSTVENFDEADSKNIGDVFMGATGFLIMTEIGARCGIMSHAMSGGAMASAIEEILRIRPDVKLALAHSGVIKLGKLETAGLMMEMMKAVITGKSLRKDDDVEKWK